MSNEQKIIAILTRYEEDHEAIVDKDSKVYSHKCNNNNKTTKGHQSIPMYRFCFNKKKNR